MFATTGLTVQEGLRATRQQATHLRAPLRALVASSLEEEEEEVEEW